MRFNIVSNLQNGVGLQRDYELLRHELENRGHTVCGVQFNAKPPEPIQADVNIFLEVVTPSVFGAAPKQWAVPNPEWWFADWDRYPWDLVLAKTHDCERIFRAKVGDRCQYLGWRSRDLYRPEFPRHLHFLHVAGKSQFKNTHAVVTACQRMGVRLTVVSEQTGRHVSDQELAFLMNSHFCQIMPSEYEGYGHVLHEAMGVGQIIITTDAPPMNELENVFLVSSATTRKHHEGTLHRVDASALMKQIAAVLNLNTDAIARYRGLMRAQYVQEVQAFQTALNDLV